MVTEVHQVFIVAPEVRHIQTGGTAADGQCFLHAALVSHLSVHIQHSDGLAVSQRIGLTLAALVGRQAHVEPLDQVDIGV